MTDAIKSTTEKLLVCIGPGPNSAKLVHAAQRMAADLKAPMDCPLCGESPDADAAGGRTHPCRR